MKSPGAAVLQTLAETDPNLADFASSVEASEQAAMSTLISDLQSEYGAGIAKDTTSITNFELIGYTRPIVVKSFKNAALVPVEHKLRVAGDSSEGPGYAGVILSLLSSMLGDMVSPSLPNGAEMSKSATETKDGSTTTMSLEMGRNSDGTTKFGMGMKTESLQNGKSVKVEFNTKMDGQRCPNAEGQVSFTVKTTVGVNSGASGYTQDLTAFVRAVVGEDAQIASTTVDVIQGTQSTKGGRSVYVETGSTFKHKGEDIASSTESNFRVNQATDNANRSDQKLSDDGLTAALVMGEVSLNMAKNKWLDGACTKIEAQLADKVQPGSTTDIPVTVRQRFEGIEIPSKLKAELSGEKSIEPTSLAKTPGTLIYTASDKKQKSVSITLTETSRRGRSTLKLTTKVGNNSYTASGGGNGLTVSGRVEDITLPFTLNGVFQGGTATFNYTPQSDTAGSVTYSGGGNGVTMKGDGSYTISGSGDGPLTMTVTTTGCVNVGGCKTNTDVITLTPDK
jgi:hypothetical protein